MAMDETNDYPELISTADLDPDCGWYVLDLSVDEQDASPDPGEGGETDASVQ